VRFPEVEGDCDVVISEGVPAFVMAFFEFEGITEVNPESREEIGPDTTCIYSLSESRGLLLTTLAREGSLRHKPW
jgi:hypothetical protein